MELPQQVVVVRCNYLYDFARSRAEHCINIDLLVLLSSHYFTKQLKSWQVRIVNILTVSELSTYSTFLDIHMSICIFFRYFVSSC